MAAVTPDSLNGASITFSSGFLANVLSVDWSGISREALDTTTIGINQAGRTYKPAKTYDPGELAVEMQFDSDGDFNTPIIAAAEAVTVTLDDAETWGANGFLTGFEWGSSEGEIITATATLKFTGDITD